ncbi:uncharacterized protein LOC132746488 isoform X2 [Ruditapes philippinarum]|uniref:uncharacterized protein LOC132746488 isoform X2 n=1 Tax=Ruditapes philippinarum TaxID=129788 RepID=UPI00295BACA8|nr:uncharacterized protein LOC132746488 isoform X2 [Ruditapes philippinarum]
MDNRRAENQERKCVRGYHEIFHTKERHNKKIYVLGDVGTGKSTFCKMMIENWCYAVTGLAKGSSFDENVTDRTIPSDKDKANKYNDDVSQLRQYEFLFFIPLQFMSALKSDVTVDMIKELTREFSSNTELIDKIFQEDSRRCLIIADSLDEWKPPKEVVQKPHVSYGIPNGDRAKDATVIILSRPSSTGILNLKNSEIDLKLQLLGITNESLKSFIKRYIFKFSVRKKSWFHFLSLCRSKGIEHVEKTPLLLQQLLWLYCNDKELGNSVSETYCHIFNTMYGWLDQKTKGRENDASQTKEDYKKVDLPAMLKKFPRLKEKSHVLFRLGKIAYETLTSDIQTASGLSCLIKKDLVDSDVNELKRFGILNESNCYDPTLEDTQLSFIHISYLEFFAALYITTYYTIDSITKNDSVLDELFGTCKSASDVLQLSNVIKMSCELSPALISYLSKRISCIVNEDEQILNLRKNEIFRRNDKVVLIQRLIVTCLKECGSDNKSLITLSDLYIDDFEHFPPFQIIIPKGVISMTIKDDRTASYLPSLKSVLQEAHLRHLTLAHLECYHNGGHNIDLSRQNHLQTLTLVECPDVVITGLNTEQLEKVLIDNDYAVHYFINTLNFNLISQANKLNELHLQYLSGNIASLVALIQHLTLKELTLIGISDSQCNVGGHVSNNQSDVEGDIKGVSDDQSDVEGHMKSISNDQPDVGCHMRGMSDGHSDVKGVIRGVSYDHDQSGVEGHIKGVIYDQSDVKSHMRGFPDDQSTVEGVMRGVFNTQPDADAHMHAIDLSKQNKLQTLQLYDCKNMTISNLNTEQLEYLHISDGVLDFDLLKNANRLIGLYLHGKFLYQQDNHFKYSEQINDVVHTLHHIRILRLEIVDIYSNSLTVTPEMKCLRAIELYQVNMKFDTWCIFVDSLLTLQQYVEVLAAPTDEKKCYYVRTNSKFKVINKVKRKIHFKSRI